MHIYNPLHNVCRQMNKVKLFNSVLVFDSNRAYINGFQSNKFKSQSENSKTKG